MLDGSSAVEESMLTSEPMPVSKRSGDKLMGAPLNTTGALTIRAERVGSSTMLAQIVQIVVQVQRSKAPMQRKADTVTGYFVFTVVSIAVLTLCAWGIFGPASSWSYGLINALAALIIACLCALGLATPMSIMVATGSGATHGVLFHNTATIENFRKINTVIVDKTGMLTEGKPVFHSAVAMPGFDADNVLRLAASLKQGSEHLLAHAIVLAARERGLAVDGRLAGLLAVADPIKDSTAEALASLTAAGIRIVMASGDGIGTAQAVAKQLGITEVYGEVQPADKPALVVRLQKQGRKVAMAGDGTNDAPALAQADVGIAVGTGTDVAMHSAQVTRIKGDLRGTATARALSNATMANMRQNLGFAFVYNVLGVPLAAGILFPWTGWLLSPMVAALAMSLGSASVTTNALRLRQAALKTGTH